jgi:periplasmic protein CpxP/Spy
MSKIKLLIAAVAGLLLVNLGLVTFLFFRKPPYPAQGRGRMEKEGPKKFIIEKLHFDKEQTAQYEALITAHQVSIKSLRGSISTEKNNLYQLLAGENAAGRDSLITLLGSLQQQIELAHYKHFDAIKKLCRPDQLNDFNKLTKELADYFAPAKKDVPLPKD